jgi:hypothetical protein
MPDILEIAGGGIVILMWAVFLVWGLTEMVIAEFKGKNTITVRPYSA